MTLSSGPIAPGTAFVDPSTGHLTETAFRTLLALWQRTGGAAGADITAVQSTANTAKATATAAQTAATAAQTSATSASSAVTAETTRAEAAEALLAPKASPSFTGTVTNNGATWTAGTGAPTSTQPVGSIYSRTDGTSGARLYVSAGGGTWSAVAGV